MNHYLKLITDLQDEEISYDKLWLVITKGQFCIFLKNPFLYFEEYKLHHGLTMNDCQTLSEEVQKTKFRYCIILVDVQVQCNLKSD